MPDQNVRFRSESQWSTGSFDQPYSEGHTAYTRISAQFAISSVDYEGAEVRNDSHLDAIQAILALISDGTVESIAELLHQRFVAVQLILEVLIHSNPNGYGPHPLTSAFARQSAFIPQSRAHRANEAAPLHSGCISRSTSPPGIKRISHAAFQSGTSHSPLVGWPESNRKAPSPVIETPMKHSRPRRSGGQAVNETSGEYSFESTI
jgi:hypothetical protein